MKFTTRSCVRTIRVNNKASKHSKRKIRNPYIKNWINGKLVYFEEFKEENGN